VQKRSVVLVKDMAAVQAARSAAAAGTRLAGVGPRSAYAKPFIPARSPSERGGGGSDGDGRAPRAGDRAPLRPGAGALRAAGALRVGGLDGAAAARLAAQHARPQKAAVGLNLVQVSRAAALPRLAPGAAAALAPATAASARSGATSRAGRALASHAVSGEEEEDDV